MGWVEPINSCAAQIHPAWYDRFSPERQGKRGLSRGPAGCCSICPQDVRQLFGPISLSTVQSFLQSTQDRLVNGFGLSIALRVRQSRVPVHNAYILAKSRKALLSNCIPLSKMRVFGTPNLVTIFFHTNFLTSTSRIFANASASAYLVK